VTTDSFAIFDALQMCVYMYVCKGGGKGQRGNWPGKLPLKQRLW